jgi:hypothetical protein
VISFNSNLAVLKKGGLTFEIKTLVPVKSRLSDCEMINLYFYRTVVTQNVKISVLGAANVGLYSNYFWDFALNNSDEPYHQIAFDLNATGNLYKIKWADLIGFVVGAGVGSAAGPLTAVSTGIALGGFASKIFGE